MFLSDFYARITPQQNRLGEILHDLILNSDPRIAFVVKHNSPFYSTKKNVAYISPDKTGLLLGFVQGTTLNNDFGLLSGDQKQVRHLRIPNLEFLTEHEQKIKAYLYEAIERSLAPKV